MQTNDICFVKGQAGIYHEGKVIFPDGTSTHTEPDIVLRIMDEEPPLQVNSMELPALEYGSRGLMVYMMQALLNWHGYKITQDGAFGFKTHEALHEFRHQNYLDGETVCDSITWKCLMAE